MSPRSTRWCPTPEQLMILQELYRRGLRNPNASQIQNITAHLSFYGKIQGKSVFYWFQNHKARDRQKLRKKLAKELHQQQLLQQHPHQPTPSAFHQYFNCYSTHRFYAQDKLDEWYKFIQGSGACGEALEGMVKQIRRRADDLPKDQCLIRSYGHDSMMIVDDVGPTFPCCRNRNLETLELFPLRSPTLKDQEATAV
ncbi:hypothetical protein DH2020_021358 [Rehmannia glutinosa]|uniref:Homeobox domain-containing protein n=1 Tax=Rehmannia glutinosa TaxID=99300 RepID=A0ABR0WAQ9_REHGL